MRFTNQNYKTGSGRFLLLDNCRFNFGLHQLKTIIGEYIVLDYQSIKVLGKVLLNEYMVPFDASVLLLVAMIGTVLLSKKKNRNNEQYFK
jgi:hypothetical protein